MSPTGAAIVPGAGSFAGHFEFFDAATLLTNIDPTNLAAGLKNNSTFSMTGRFDLTAPGPFVLYGIRFEDLAGDGDDIARVQVGPGGIVAFTVQVGSVVTAVGSFPLNTAHDQIALTLTKGDPSASAITASFQYFDGGVGGPVTTFAASADLFHGENWTQGQFFFGQEIVPEPSALTLLASGLAGLAGIAVWRRRK